MVDEKSPRIYAYTKYLKVFFLDGEVQIDIRPMSEF